MRKDIIFSLAVFVIVAFSIIVKDSNSTVEKKSTTSKFLQDRLLARVNGKGIHLSDLNYDIQKRYDFELHKLEVKLYRELRSELDGVVDQMLLKKEAEKRMTTPDKLSAMIDSKVEKKKKDIENKKDELFQEFFDRFKKKSPEFLGIKPQAMRPEMFDNIIETEGSLNNPFIEGIKNKIVQMKKESIVRDSRNEVFDELRSKANIEFLLERPELINLDISADDDPFLGNKDAKITLIEFADYQCPFCSKARLTLTDLLAKKGDQIKIVFRDLPLSSHKNAKMAAEAAECADEQGKFWEYNDLLFDNQQLLDIESLKEYAKTIDLDTEKFNHCFDSGKQAMEVEQDATDAKKAGIRSTPTILINGYYISGLPSLAYLEEVIADIERGKTPRVQEDLGKG